MVLPELMTFTYQHEVQDNQIPANPRLHPHPENPRTRLNRRAGSEAPA